MATETLEQTRPDPLESAKEAGLHYVTDTAPGIRRKRAGKNFSYIGVDGKPIRDERVLQRIKALGIPPAYEDVWICADPNGHLQATGRVDLLGGHAHTAIDGQAPRGARACHAAQHADLQRFLCVAGGGKGRDAQSQNGLLDEPTHALCLQVMVRTDQVN